MPFGLSDQSIDQLKQLFKKFDQITEVKIYGSRALGTYNEGSDIDLVVYGNQINNDLINEIELAIDDLLLPWIIDLSAYSDIKNKDLLEHINRVGQCLYKKKRNSN